jgi:hypothetical protein
LRAAGFFEVLDVLETAMVEYLLKRGMRHGRKDMIRNYIESGTA